MWGCPPTIQFPLLLARSLSHKSPPPSGACLRSPLSPAWERVRVRGLPVNRKNPEFIRLYLLLERSHPPRFSPIEGE